jgi:hypothetical protein
MPIVEDTPQAPPIEKPNTVKITKPQYKGIVVDTRYVPNTALLSHVEGMSYVVNYYSQVLDYDSALMGQSVNVGAEHQQYRLIKDFELKVTSGLSTTQDATTKSLTITGTANVYPFLIPNEGDMFLADMGDGREGVFRVTSSDRKSALKETIHVIDYVWVDYSTELRRGDLNQKTIQTLQFFKDYLNYGQNPLLEEEDVTILRALTSIYGSMMTRYFKAFMSNEYKTLLMPGQTESVYDSFLVNSVMSYFTTYDSPEIRYVRKLNVDDDDVLKCTTVWDALRARDMTLMKYAARRVGLMGTRTFTRNPRMEGIYHSGIRYVVYPKDPDLTIDYQLVPRLKIMEDTVITNGPSAVRSLSDLLSDKEFMGLAYPDAPPIHPITDDDYYIFSQAFYDNADVGQSKLELCVRDYLNLRAPNKQILLALAQTQHSWNAVESFYYTPILLILIKATIIAF